ncbi:hypothetical protein MSAS_02360 [Mycobacterium saskatchewanense]|uniref:DUF5666 domain-containing protein n=1 Tax=Mycobacterium saskatchewanense TaxID=220927 RepID=UPI00138C7B30|nr:DUF5666 domain-containing protein [Mycobacterium saskatchewanense]BBX61062.1 hypothetical protein MSAS_02360 [Mycobacterium saskatchewanense]
MSATPRLTRFAILTVAGATALSVAACGSSNNASQTSTSTSTSTVTSTTTAPAPAQGEAKVSGLIASVAGNSIQVTKQDNTNATVNFTSTTKITEVAPATLSDVTSGSCVTVRPTKEQAQGQPVTAASVRLSPSVNGTCPQPKAGPGASTAPPSGPPSPGPAQPKPLQGSVASVSGNTITVAGADGSGNTTQTAVTVDDKTKYSKLATATPDTITQGKCVTARGTTENGGALQATSINVRAAVEGKCGKPQGH